jgi:hypothetical protein
MPAAARASRCRRSGLERRHPHRAYSSLHDPDGMWCEVMWMPPGASFDDIKRAPEWEMIDPS